MSDDPAAVVTGAPIPPAVSQYGTKGLKAYLLDNQSTFTDSALKDAAIAAGWEAAIVDGLLRKLHTRESVAPLRARARRIVRALYAGGFVVLVAAMALNPLNRIYGGFVIGSIVLAVALLVAYVLGRLWLNRKDVDRTMSTGDLLVLLSVPVILWLVVTGLCIATGLPIPRPA